MLSPGKQTSRFSPRAAEPPLPALLKLLAIVIQANKSQDSESDSTIALVELQAGGLSEEEVQVLLKAGYIKEPLAIGVHLPCLGDGSGSPPGGELALTAEGWGWITGAVNDLHRAPGRLSSSILHPEWAASQGGGGQLRLGGVGLKRVRHDAMGQISVLEELERSGWAEWIPNPLTGGRGTKRKKALRDTIGRLNRGQKPQRVKFHVQDGGIAWEIIA